MRPRYRGILFDLDGTLVDSLELILSSYRHTIAEHLGTVLPDEAWLDTMGMPLNVQLRSFAESEDQLERMFSTYIAHNETHHDRLIRPFPGMRQAITALHGAGYRLCVVTSKIREHAERELRSCLLAEFFADIISANDVEKPKPHPEPVLRGLEALKLVATEALFVGDSLHDLRAGQAAGVATAAALWGPFGRERLSAGKPSHWLEDVADLLALLGLSATDEDG
jgi:pyrophosphatase PpaX